MNPYFTLFMISNMDATLLKDILTIVKRLYVHLPNTYLMRRIGAAVDDKDNTFPLKVDKLESTVNDVKKMIYDKSGIHVKQQSLYSCKCTDRLENDKRLIDYMILDGDTIHILVSSHSNVLRYVQC
jgi:uncharacterized ubiquitin-like protein YukD